MMRKVVTLIVTAVLIVAGGFLVFFLLDKPEIDTYERTTMSVDVTISVKNLGSAPAMDVPIRLALPLDIPDRQELISVSYSHEPSRVSNDSFGNDFVHFDIPILPPQGQFNLTLTLGLKVWSRDITLSHKGGSEENLSKYILESALINVNDENVLERARSISSMSSDILDITWNTYEWVIENIRYQQVAGELDAATTLRNMEGGSAEIANLYVALLRANGVPARRISGWGYHFAEGDDIPISNFAHGWAEFNVPGFGWIQVDPTWGKAQKFDNYAKTDPYHIALTLGAGVHYLWRGPFTTPYGETSVDTDYSIHVKDLQTKNLSLKRDIIYYLILALPLLFVIFIMIKVLKRRKNAE